MNSQEKFLQLQTGLCEFFSFLNKINKRFKYLKFKQFLNVLWLFKSSVTHVFMSGLLALKLKIKTCACCVKRSETLVRLAQRQERKYSLQTWNCAAAKVNSSAMLFTLSETNGSSNGKSHIHIQAHQQHDLPLIYWTRWQDKGFLKPLAIKHPQRD